MSAIADFRGGQFLGASWEPQRGDSAARTLRAQLAGWHVVSGDGWLLATDTRGHHAETNGIVAATAVPRLFDREAASLCGAAALAAKLGEDSDATLVSLGAPFRLAWADRARETISAATDMVGLGPVFWLRNDEIAACASSALLLARLFETPASIDDIASFALFGSFPFEATPFTGVSKLLGGQSLRLHHGQAAIAAPQPPAFAEANIADAFTAAVHAMATAAPEATLELSGGLDSRLIVAALPDEDRRSRLAITIDESGGRGGDAQVARRIAALTGMSHREIAVPFDVLQDGAALTEALRLVTNGYDAMANPIDKLPLTLVSGTGEMARFGGQNGEIMRGFYYPMQPLADKPTPQVIAGLVDWRLIANDRASPRLFTPAFANETLGAARDRMIAALGRFEGSWGQALDQIYLGFRMQSWAGNPVGNRFLERTILWPFFDRRFLATAMKLDPGAKRDSLAAYRLLAQLSPQLAALPLDNGLVPKAMAQGGNQARLMNLWAKAKKARRKIAQRISPRSAAVLGSARIIDAWHATGGYARLDLAGLAAMGLFDPAALEAIGSGQNKPDRATLGFLLLCEAWQKP